MIDKILSEYRAGIDNIDEEIVKLLVDRVSIVKKVGEYKNRSGQKGSIIRPGREATMIKDITAKFGDDSIPKAAVAQMWRIIISSCINIEEDTKIAVLSNKDYPECYWLSREYFGAFSFMDKKATRTEVIHDLKEGRVTVGIIVLNDDESSDPWWSRITNNEDRPKIFAKLPFIQLEESKKPPIIALAFVEPENTGEDESIWVIKADEFIQPTEIRNFLENAGIEYNVIEESRELSLITMHNYLIKITGFITQDDKRIAKFLKDINEKYNSRPAPTEAYYLGSYAIPMTFSKGNKNA